MKIYSHEYIFDRCIHHALEYESILYGSTDYAQLQMFLFYVISTLERKLRYVIFQNYKNNEWIHTLSNKRIIKIRSESNHDLDILYEKLIVHTQLYDLRTIVSNDRSIRELLELGSSTKVKSKFNKIVKLRDMVVHSQDFTNYFNNNMIDIVKYIIDTINIIDHKIPDLPEY